MYYYHVYSIAHTSDWFFEYFLHLLHGLGVFVLGKEELTLDDSKVLLEQIPSLSERLPDQGLAVKVKQIKSENGHLNLDLGLVGIFALSGAEDLKKQRKCFWK